MQFIDSKRAEKRRNEELKERLICNHCGWRTCTGCDNSDDDCGDYFSGWKPLDPQKSCVGCYWMTVGLPRGMHCKDFSEYRAIQKTEKESHLNNNEQLMIENEQLHNHLSNVHHCNCDDRYDTYLSRKDTPCNS